MVPNIPWTDNAPFFGGQATAAVAVSGLVSGFVDSDDSFTGGLTVFFIDCRLRIACRRALFALGPFEFTGSDPLAVFDSTWAERAFSP